MMTQGKQNNTVKDAKISQDSLDLTTIDTVVLQKWIKSLEDRLEQPAQAMQQQCQYMDSLIQRTLTHQVQELHSALEMIQKSSQNYWKLLKDGIQSTRDATQSWQQECESKQHELKQEWERVRHLKQTLESQSEALQVQMAQQQAVYKSESTQLEKVREDMLKQLDKERRGRSQLQSKVKHQCMVLEKLQSELQLERKQKESKVSENQRLLEQRKLLQVRIVELERQLAQSQQSLKQQRHQQTVALSSGQDELKVETGKSPLNLDYLAFERKLKQQERQQRVEIPDKLRQMEHDMKQLMHELALSSS